MSEKKIDVKLSQIPAETRDIQKIIDHRGQKTFLQYVTYGQKNDFPDYLNDLYMESAQMNSIVDTIVDYICGEHVEFNTAIRTQLNGNTGAQLKNIFRRISFDKVLYGGFALKLTYNRTNQIAEIGWLDLRNLRISGDEKCVYFSENFGRGRRGEMLKYTLWEYFTPGNDENSEYECVYYYKGNSRYVYPVPSYVGSLRAIETSIEIDKFHFSSIQNNLAANTIININDSGDYTEEEKREIEREMRQNFTGTRNGSNFILAFNDSKENAVTVERLQDDNYDKKYEALAENTRKNIFVGFRIMPVLAGFPPESGGFNKTEYAEAFELFNQTVILPHQKQMINCFNELFGLLDSLEITEFSIKIQN